jgi:predicted nucleic acid-binding protein
MINKIFIDSSVLIETYKGNKVDFYQSIFSNNNNQLFINEIVLSEYLYYVLGFNAGVSPRTLQQKNQIINALESAKEQVNILEEFHFLTGNQDFIFDVPRLMSIYNLLPNDAIILAACKFHRIGLASHDSDFIIPCESENIELLRDI